MAKYVWLGNISVSLKKSHTQIWEAKWLNTIDNICISNSMFLSLSFVHVFLSQHTKHIRKKKDVTLQNSVGG